MTKEEEKELRRLNDELKKYIQKNRLLELNNERYKKIINLFGTDLNAEWNEVRNEKQKIIDDLKNNLRDEEKKKNQAILEKNKMKFDLDAANNKIYNLENNISQLNQTINQLREFNAKQTVTIDTLNDELRQKDKQIKDLNEKLNDCKSKINSLWTDLDNEKLLVEELKKINQDLKTQSEEDARCWETERKQLIKKINEKFNVPEVDEHVLDEMNDTYEQQIKELRDLADNRFNELKHSMDRQYNDEIRALKDTLENFNSQLRVLNNQLNDSNEEGRMCREEKDKLAQNIRELEEKLKKMDDLHRNRNKRYTEEVDEKNKRIQRLENDIIKLRDEFNKAFDDKISLERELKVYKDLLEFEEERLRYINTTVNSVTLTARSNYSLTSGNSIVLTQERDNYVAIFNTSAQDFVLNKNSTLRAIGNSEEKTYTIPRDINISAGSHIKIWKKSSPEKTDALTDFYAKFTWPIGNNMESILSNQNGAVISIRRNINI